MSRLGIVRFASIAAIVVCSEMPSRAHEFWIDPVPRQEEAGGKLSTDLRVGQGFEADAYPYLSSGFNTFRLAVRGQLYEIVGNEGDMPAINLAPLPEGLNVLAYYGRANRVTIEEAAVFEDYLALEGLDWVMAAHKKRGLPPTGFSEAFSRNVKSLVQAGPVSKGDEDVVTGMPFELVAGLNPYVDPDLQALPVTLLWEGKPAPDIQLTVFQESDERTRTVLRTDAMGKALVPLGDGGRFILNAVHMRAAPDELDAAWESHWASLTFHIPAR